MANRPRNLSSLYNTVKVGHVPCKYDTGFRPHTTALRGGVHWLLDLINVGERGGVESSRAESPQCWDIVSSPQVHRWEPPCAQVSSTGKGLWKGRCLEMNSLYASPLDPLSFCDEELHLAGALKKIRLSLAQVIDERQKNLLKYSKKIEGTERDRTLSFFYRFLTIFEGL